VAATLDKIVTLDRVSQSITVDNGTEFASKAMDHWAYKQGVRLDFIRPGRPAEKGSRISSYRWPNLLGAVPLTSGPLTPHFLLSYHRRKPSFDTVESDMLN